MSIREAIREYVKDGDVVYVGGLIHSEPYFAVHELIRQRKENLTISTAGATLWGDMLVGAGCVDRMITTYTWNPVPMAGHCFRRAIEKGVPRPLEMEEYSLLALGLAYFAGSMGLPFIGTKTMLGSDMLSQKSFMNNRKFKEIDCPFTGERSLAIAPVTHDVGIVQVQRCDSQGNAQAWGCKAITTYGMNACKRLIVCTEEIVPNEVIKRDPDRTVVPGFKTSAVVEAPWGGYPSFMQGYYDRDWKFFPRYARQTATEDGMNRYLDEWVYGVNDHEAYLNKIGTDKRRLLGSIKKDTDTISYGCHDRFI